MGGTLTGRGGDALIIDDPIKANDANSEVALKAASDWFRNTALSRLDDPKDSLIIATMQRLHVDDLAGILIEQGWPRLAIPAIAAEPADYVVGEGEVFYRPVGQLLQPDRDRMIGSDAPRSVLSHGYSDRIIRQWAGAKNHDTTATINAKTSHGMVPKGPAHSRSSYRRFLVTA